MLHQAHPYESHGELEIVSPSPGNGREVNCCHANERESVRIQKRSNRQAMNAYNIVPSSVSGIERVGFVAHIEAANIFLTAYGWWIFALVVLAAVVCISKGLCEVWMKRGELRNPSLEHCRSFWKLYFQGLLYLLVSHVTCTEVNSLLIPNPLDLPILCTPDHHISLGIVSARFARLCFACR